MGKDEKKKKRTKQKTQNKITKIDAIYKRHRRKDKATKSSSNFYYSFLTIVLLICLIQIGVSAILNISKTIAYHNKIETMKQLRNAAESKNKQLKKELSEFSTTKSLEAIARNNLKMAGDDEVLIIINKEKQEDLKNKRKKGIFNVGKHDKH